MTAYWGRVMQQSTLNPHLEAIDGMIGAGHFATGGGMSGVNGAREFLRQWDYMTQPIYDKAPKVGYKTDATRPGKRTYYEGEQSAD